MDVTQLIQSANRIKASRMSSLDKKALPVIAKPVTGFDLLDTARKIQEKRKPSTGPLKPLPVQKFARYAKAFVCRDLFGIELSAFPTPHAVEQFTKRYHFIDHFFNPKSEEEVLDKMRTIFNQCRHTTNYAYMERNKTHNAGKEVIGWGDDNLNFIVNTIDQVIITFELRGKLGKYNRY